jgi:multiple antibiotic resistance protein
MNLVDHFLKDLVTFWVVIDPISSIPVFLAATRHMTDGQRARTAIKATAIASFILVGFIVAGQLALEEMGIQLPSFQIAGGLVLFVFAMRMIFQQENSDGEGKEGHDVAVYPLAVPSIAGPAAMMAAVVLTDNHRYSIQNQAFTALVMLLVLIICSLVLLLSGRIKRLIGDGGIDILGRVMGLVLAALAVQTVVDALPVVLLSLRV